MFGVVTQDPLQESWVLAWCGGVNGGVGWVGIGCDACVHGSSELFSVPFCSWDGATGCADDPSPAELVTVECGSSGADTAAASGVSPWGESGEAVVPDCVAIDETPTAVRHRLKHECSRQDRDGTLTRWLGGLSISRRAAFSFQSFTFAKARSLLAHVVGTVSHLGPGRDSAYRYRRTDLLHIFAHRVDLVSHALQQVRHIPQAGLCALDS